MCVVYVSGQQGTHDMSGMSFKVATGVFRAAGRPITLTVAQQPQQKYESRVGTVYTVNNPEVGCVDFRNTPTPANLSGEQTLHGAIHTSLQETADWILVALPAPKAPNDTAAPVSSTATRWLPRRFLLEHAPAPQSQNPEQGLDEEHTMAVIEGDGNAQALLAAGVSRPASPPRAHEQLSQGISAEQLSLSEALNGARLNKYEDAFRDLGCEIVQDLADLEEQDLMEIGMKKVEIVRLKRLVPNFGGSE